MRQPYIRHGYIILNPYGSVWSVDLFDTTDDAWKNLKEFWGEVPYDEDKFRVVTGKVEVTPTDTCQTCGKPLDEK